MSVFDEKQISQLKAPLSPDRVRTLKGRDGKPVIRDGRPVEYVETWDDLEQANQIFGFGRWSRETVHVEAVHTPVPRTNERGEITDMVASFWARVRITVLSEDGTRSIVREGCGAATSHQKFVGDAVEMAIKAAESDATKRAFATFGNQFGLALYDRERRNVGHDAPALPKGQPRAAIDVGFGDAESARESGPRAHDRAPDPAPRGTNSQRALATLEPRPKSNGGLRY